MIYVQRWNAKEHKYKPYKIQKGWYISMYEEDMDKFVNCCQCGKRVRFGDTYTSLEVHSSVGFGYGVCEKCYAEEQSRRLKYANK